MPVGKIVFPDGGDTRYYIDKTEVTEAEFRAAFPDAPDGGCPMGAAPSCWPMKSEALAVHPDQVAEGNARNERMGSTVRYEPGTGMAIIPDRNERRKLLKIEKFHDKQGGYGDG